MHNLAIKIEKPYHEHLRFIYKYLDVLIHSVAIEKYFKSPVQMIPFVYMMSYWNLCLGHPPERWRVSVSWGPNWGPAETPLSITTLYRIEGIEVRIITIFWLYLAEFGNSLSACRSSSNLLIFKTIRRTLIGPSES